ncbi:unnamed protein product [Soboliphyme baturini]|uniref:ERC protein 2 n=1 Tax=Soboliphyme baturini TaxID=241478 RepID=A0A183IT23_9BILA|nr:unnamed protein product [Soboliphyme baturini]
MDYPTRDKDGVFHLYSRIGASRTAPASPLLSRNYNSYSLSDPASAYNSPDRAVLNNSLYASSLKSEAFVSDVSASLPSSFLALNCNDAIPSYNGAYYPSSGFDSTPINARRAAVASLRHHSSCESSFMPMVGDTYGNDPVPPADPQILMPVLYGSPGSLRRQYSATRALNNNVATVTTNYPSYPNPLTDTGDGLSSEMARFACGSQRDPPYGSTSVFTMPTDVSSNIVSYAGRGGGSSYQERDLNSSSVSASSIPMDRDALRRELDSSSQKLNAMMNSIRTFWSPELKKERALRKEESSKLMVAHEHLKMAVQESQRQAALVRQLQNELQCQTELCQSMRQGQLSCGVSREEYEALLLERDM